MSLQVYDKIQTLYKRYIFDANKCPNKAWVKFKNKIILGEFSFKEAGYSTLFLSCQRRNHSIIDFLGCEADEVHNLKDN